MKRTVLIFTVDRIPVSDSSISGGGLRAWSIGQALKSKGHEVVYSLPEKHMDPSDTAPELKEYAFDPLRLSKVIRKVVPDIILFEQWGLLTYLDQTNIPVVVDLHGSLILENHFRHHRSFKSNVAAKIKALAKADFLICAAERQKSYFLPWLMLSGLPFEEERIAVIPVSLSPNLPEKRESAQPVFVFGGGLWPWIDPFPCLGIVAETLKATKKGTLKLFTRKPETPKVLPKDDFSGTWSANLERMNLNDRVDFRGWVPHRKMIEEYRAASAAVDLYQWNRERELAFSTRTIEFLWCGIPAIHADYSEIAPHIREYRAGWCLDPKDTDGIRQAVSDILSNSPKVRQFSANAQRLVRDRFVWDKTIDPLANFVSRPYDKGRKQTFFDLVSLEFDRIEEELEQKNKEDRQALSKTSHELAVLREKYEADLRGRDGEIWRLNQEIHKFRDQLMALQDEKNKQNIETRDLIEKWETVLQDSNKTIDRLNSEVTSLNGKLSARDENISMLTEKISGLEELKRSMETDVLRYQREMESLSKNEAALQKIIVDLKNSLKDASDNVKYMDGVLKSIQNRLMYRWYKRTTFRLKRLVVQYPRLFYLLILNIMTNTYMSRWCNKKKTRIFPSQ